MLVKGATGNVFLITGPLWGESTSHHQNPTATNRFSSQRASNVKLWCFNTLRPRQNGRHFADNIFKRIFLNENILISIKISLKLVPKGSIYNIPALVQIMAWRRPGDKPLSEPMMVNLPTHICVTRPQCFIIPPCFNEVCWFHVVRPSVRPSSCLWTKSCTLCIFYNTSRIYFIYAHLIKQLQKVCRM